MNTARPCSWSRRRDRPVAVFSNGLPTRHGSHARLTALPGRGLAQPRGKHNTHSSARAQTENAHEGLLPAQVWARWKHDKFPTTKKRGAVLSHKDTPSRCRGAAMTRRAPGQGPHSGAQYSIRQQKPTSSDQPTRRTVPGGSRRWYWPAAYQTFLKTKRASVKSLSRRGCRVQLRRAAGSRCPAGVCPHRYPHRPAVCEDNCGKPLG